MRIRKQTFRRWNPGRAGRAAATALLGALTLALLVWFVALPATHVQAATYTVNAADDVDDGTCDGGHCSLREAINAANATVDNDVIAIGVAGPIVLNAPLPIITDDDLIITGSGQQVSMTAPGTAIEINADRVQINNLIIDGEGVGSPAIEIRVGIDDVVLDGLTVRDFAGPGIVTIAPGGGQRIVIRNSTVTDNQGNGVVLRGNDVTIQDSIITNNGWHGLLVADVNGCLIQGNTFSGNSQDQISISSVLAGDDVTLFRNSILSGSDGIVIEASVNAAANVDIGLSVPNRNVFRGAIAAPAEQHVRNLSGAHINAIFNDWDAYNPAAIEGVICHNNEAPCGAGLGVVDFDPFIDTPSPLPTPTPLAPATETPGPPTETPTATPEGGLPGDVETLGLIAGCNPVAWTGEDGTPIGTISGAVAPPDILVALWASEAGMWLGFSPQFPDVSDLTEMDRLDVVFVCVSAPGTFSRPVI